MGLMSFEEMKDRYEKGEESLELALEKWQRILVDSRTVFHLSHFQQLLKAAIVPLMLCVEYDNQCHMCPIFSVCRRGYSEDWNCMLRIIQAYAIAGDLLPLEPYVGQLESFVKKLRLCRDELYMKAN